MVAMTEDEKKRLEEILSDTGDLMEKVRECIVSLLRMVQCKMLPIYILLRFFSQLTKIL